MLHKKASKKEQGAEASNSAPKSPASRAVSSSLEAMLFLLATVVVVAAIGPVAGWWHYEVIESGSMTPALRVGGVAVLWPEPVSSVRAGQIIAVHPPGAGNEVRIHRVIAVTDRDGQVWVRTKGDANNAPDPGLMQARRHDGLRRALFRAIPWLSRRLAIQAVDSCRVGGRALRSDGGRWPVPDLGQKGP